MASPEATYDSLFIVRRLQDSLRGVTGSEIQLFDYLARLLAVFRGVPSADWGYLFARTNYGAPYCPEVNEALDELQTSGFLQIEADESTTTFKCTDDGSAICSALDELEGSKWRRPFLEAACSSSLTLPIATIREALRSEPSIKSAAGHIGPQALLSGPPLELLYEQFAALQAVLGDEATDLLVPSSVWLAYLLEESRKSFDAATDKASGDDGGSEVLRSD
jgi:hypothetical protein